ncbi:DsbA family protein [Rhodobacteraceae bacterium M385]|nr:DsbA family protein [Rhodobacteraceae bacterium M385]
MTQNITIQYIFDPLCGWCYGASDTMAKLAAHPSVSVQMMPSGLFSGHGARPMAGFAKQAWQNDQRIAQLSGRTFSEAYRVNVLGAADAKLDSSVATLALTAVSQEEPDREMEALKAIQEARYVDGQDVTSPAVVAALLAELSLPQAAAAVLNPDDALLRAVRDRTAVARDAMKQNHAQGVPTVITNAGQIDSSVLYAGLNKTLASLGLR